MQVTTRTIRTEMEWEPVRLTQRDSSTKKNVVVQRKTETIPLQ